MTNETQATQKLATWRQAGNLLTAGTVLLVGGLATVFLHGDSNRFRFLDTVGSIAYFAGIFLLALGRIMRRSQKRRDK